MSSSDHQSFAVISRLIQCFTYTQIVIVEAAAMQLESFILFIHLFFF